MIRLDGLAAALGRFFNQRLQPDRLRLVSCTVLLISTAALILLVITAQGGVTRLGPSLGGDYSHLYAAASLLNHYPADRLYDLALQDRLLHELLPALPATTTLLYVHPPLVAFLLRPLAQLPYLWSYLTWLVISLGLYLAGLRLLGKTVATFGSGEKPTVFLLALSFEPFIIECWMGGQLSAVGFFLVALALHGERFGRPLQTGFALGCCLYKPTLLVLLMPMLVVTRRWRVLGAFALCGLGMAAASWLAVGWRACESYFPVLLSFARIAAAEQTIFPVWKYVDLLAFSRLLLGGLPPAGKVLAVVLAGSALALLMRAWWRFPRLDEPGRRLVWAGTLTATLVCNLYAAVYDTVLAVPAALWTADVLRSRSGGRLGAPFKGLMVLMYVTPWVSQRLAVAVGFQPYTLVLAALAGYQLRLALRGAERG